MDNEFIGNPKDFHYMEGSESINFRKTFDLNGTQNDEMLRLYLRKAGLSDEIECLTAEQRRAFIYDIIKSNKMPGYWLPSTMQNSQRPKMQPPPPPTPSSFTTYSIAPSTTNAERRNTPDSEAGNYTTMRTSISAGNLQNLNTQQHFIRAPATPPSPSTFVTSSKGRQYEISGPFNFQHTAGDMNRDMTRNAFDLSPSSNDNVLRKYMMERGIAEEDVTGMRKTDLIRKIVQSKFTWMPTKKNKSTKSTTPSTNLRLNYATISGYPDNPKTPLRPPLNFSPQNSPSPTATEAKPDFSNFTLVASRFADVKRFPTPDELYGTSLKPTSTSKIDVIPLPPLPPGTQLPSPPPRKSQYSSASLPTIKRNAPPPPLVIAAQPNASNIVYQTRNPGDYDNNFESQPLYMTNSKPNEPNYEQVEDLPKANNRNLPPPPPTPPKPYVAKTFPSPAIMNVAGKIPPPPPIAGMTNIPPPPPMTGLENNYQVVKKNTISPKSNGFIPAPPPAPPQAGVQAVPPPPLPPQNTSVKSTTNTNEDSRDAFLESIRKGVALKKIDQKSATISGVKPRAESRPQITDFLSELKMGVTSRRLKNPENNPYKDDETNEWND